MLKVAAVVRVAAKAKRFAMAPHQRFNRPAVGGGGAAAELDVSVHRYACQMAEGVEFTLTSLTEKNGQGSQSYEATELMALSSSKSHRRKQKTLALDQCSGRKWRCIC